MRHERQTSAFSMRCIVDIALATTRVGSTLRQIRRQPGRERASNTARGAARSAASSSLITHGVHLRIQGRKEVHMKKTRIIGIAVLIVGGSLALHVAWAHQPGMKRTDRATAPMAGSKHGAPLRETVTVAADKPIPNLPGKRLVSQIVDYPP